MEGQSDRQHEQRRQSNATGATQQAPSYSVRLVALSGREQPVQLRICRDGLWLYTEGGKVRQHGVQQAWQQPRKPVLLPLRTP